MGVVSRAVAAVLLLLVPVASAAPLGPGVMLSGKETLDLNVMGDTVSLPDDGGYLVPDVGLQAIAVQILGELPPTPPLGALDPLHTPWGLVGLPFRDGVVLKWNTPLGSEPDSYRVYRTVDEQSPQLIAEVEGTLHVDASAWEANATVLTYTVTATYSPGQGPEESQSSNPVVMPGGFGSCDILWVYPASGGKLIDFGINEYFLHCIGQQLTSRWSG